MASTLAQLRIRHCETFTLNLILSARILWLPAVSACVILSLFHPPVTLTESALEKWPPRKPFCDTASQDFLCSFRRHFLRSREEPAAVVTRSSPVVLIWVNFPKSLRGRYCCHIVRWVSGCQVACQLVWIGLWHQEPVLLWGFHLGLGCPERSFTALLAALDWHFLCPIGAPSSSGPYFLVLWNMIILSYSKFEQLLKNEWYILHLFHFNSIL